MHTTVADDELFWLGVIKLNPIVRLPEFLLGVGVGVAFLRFPSTAVELADRHGRAARGGGHTFSAIHPISDDAFRFAGSGIRPC